MNVHIDREGLLGGNCGEEVKGGLSFNKWVEATLGDGEEGTRGVRDTPGEHSPCNQLSGTHGIHRNQGACRGSDLGDVLARASERISLSLRAFLCEFGVKHRLESSHFLPHGR